MSNDREEIRWQFQIILDNISSEIDQTSSQLTLKDEYSERTIDRVERKRNGFLAGIGFAIPILITLILNDVLSEGWWQSVVTLAIIGGIIYYSFEWLLLKEKELILSVKVTYLNAIDGKLRPLKGMVASFALDTLITLNDSKIIRSYASLFGHAIDYDLGYSIFEMVGGTKLGSTTLYGVKIGMDEFPHEDFRKYYDKAKENLEQFNRFNFKLGTEEIEEFIRNFENNTKLKLKT